MIYTEREPPICFENIYIYICNALTPNRQNTCINNPLMYNSNVNLQLISFEQLKYYVRLCDDDDDCSYVYHQADNRGLK